MIAFYLFCAVIVVVLWMLLSFLYNKKIGRVAHEIYKGALGKDEKENEQ